LPQPTVAESVAETMSSDASPAGRQARGWNRAVPAPVARSRSDNLSGRTTLFVGDMAMLSRGCRDSNFRTLTRILGRECPRYNSQLRAKTANASDFHRMAKAPSVFPRAVTPRA